MHDVHFWQVTLWGWLKLPLLVVGGTRQFGVWVVQYRSGNTQIHIFATCTRRDLICLVDDRETWHLHSNQYLVLLFIITFILYRGKLWFPASPPLTKSSTISVRVFAISFYRRSDWHAWPRCRAGLSKLNKRPGMRHYATSRTKPLNNQKKVLNRMNGSPFIRERACYSAEISVLTLWAPAISCIMSTSLSLSGLNSQILTAIYCAMPRGVAFCVGDSMMLSAVQKVVESGFPVSSSSQSSDHRRHLL